MTSNTTKSELTQPEPEQWRKNPPGELSIDPVADELADNRMG
jgi:hypothetical protein